MGEICKHLHSKLNSLTDKKPEVNSLPPPPTLSFSHILMLRTSCIVRLSYQALLCSMKEVVWVSVIRRISLANLPTNVTEWESTGWNSGIGIVRDWNRDWKSSTWKEKFNRTSFDTLTDICTYAAALLLGTRLQFITWFNRPLFSESCCTLAPHCS